MDENPYKTPEQSEPRLSVRATMVSTVAILGLASYLVSQVIAPADPIAVYMCTLVLWFFTSAAYAVGWYQGQRQVQKS